MADVIRPQTWYAPSEAAEPQTTAPLSESAEIASGAATLDLTAPQYCDLLNRLLTYATLKVNGLVWHGPGGRPLAGTTPEDLVQTAIEKFLSGKRLYKANVPVIAFLTELIHSEISHLLDKPENRHAHASIGEGAADTPGTISAEALPDARASAEEMLIAADWLRRVQDEFGSDPVLIRYAMLLASEQFETSGEYAKVLSVSRAKIFNMNRQLQRFRKRVRGQNA